MMRFVIFLCLVAQVFSASFPAEPQTGGVYCGSTESCYCYSNARGDDCICEGAGCSGGKLIYLPKYFRAHSLISKQYCLVVRHSKMD